jgi:hypothetical protein
MKEIIIGTKSPNEDTGLVFMPYIVQETTPSISWDTSKAEKEVIAVNRERKIDSILDNIEYVPLELEETEAYKNNPWFKPKKMISSRYYSVASSNYSTINLTNKTTK